MMTCEMRGGIKVPYTKDNFYKIKSYNYLIKNSDDTFSSVVFSEDGKSIIFPRNIAKFTRVFNEPVMDCTAAPKVIKKFEMSDSFKLRPYQQIGVNEIFDNFKKGNNDVMLQAKTAYGKTIITPYIIQELQLRTLIVVDQTFLSDQMFSEITGNCDADVTQLTSKNPRFADITITTFQLLNKNPKLLESMKGEFGLLIIDEAHVAACKSIVNLTSFIDARYRLGLSATPTRSDGLDSVLTDIFSNTKVIGENPNNMTVHIHSFATNVGFKVYEMKDYRKSLDRLITSEVVENMVKDLMEMLLRVDRVTLISVDSVSAQEHYKNLYGDIARVLNSSVKSKERADILADVDSGKVKILIGFAVLQKGISIPKLDTVIHLTGASTKEKVLQLIGRLKREHEDKKAPTFIDFHFDGTMRKHAVTRAGVYRSMEKDERHWMTFKSFEEYKKAWKKD